jgi:hypothetical protein
MVLANVSSMTAVVVASAAHERSCRESTTMSGESLSATGATMDDTNLKGAMSAV